MSNDLYDFVEELKSLVRQKSLTAPRKRENTQALFAALFDKHLLAQTGPEVHRLTSSVVGQYFKAVQLCRQAALVAALAQLRLADALLTELPPATLDFVTLFKLSAWGNYYYKAQEGARGIALLLQGLRLSIRLEQQGYEFLIYRRIEQVQNIATIYYQQQEHGTADQLLKNTLTFLHSGEAAGLLVEEWNAQALGRTRIFQEFTLDESFSRLAAQNTKHMDDPAYGNEHYYHFFFRDFLRQMTIDTNNRVVLYNWMYAKASYFEQGPGAFLRNVLVFVGDEDVAPAYDVFKANLLAQVVWHHKGSLLCHQPLLNFIKGFVADHLTDRAGKVIRLAA